MIFMINEKLYLSREKNMFKYCRSTRDGFSHGQAASTLLRTGPERGPSGPGRLREDDTSS